MRNHCIIIGKVVEPPTFMERADISYYYAVVSHTFMERADTGSDSVTLISTLLVNQ